MVGKGKKTNGANEKSQRTLLQCWNKTALPSDSDDIQIISVNVQRPTPLTPATKTFIVNREGNVANESRPSVSTGSRPLRRVGNVPGKNGRRLCPFYKRVQDTPYVVDAFNYAPEEKIKGYFLSHFHSDHYVGLSSRFSHPVYCSQATANLVRLKFKVAEHLVRAMPLEMPTVLPDGTRVRLINSNHCPGAVLFVFHLQNNRVIVHTGDMRADDRLLRSTETLVRTLPPVDVLHLDTTYCDPAYSFPSQSAVIEELLRRLEAEMRRCSRLLIVVGAYQIGKERVVQAIAEQLDAKIYVQKEKWDVLRCLDDQAFLQRLTLNPRETPLHVVPMGALSSEALADYLGGFGGSYDNILGVCATGWEYSRKGSGWRVTRRGKTIVIGAPYSEHSSYDELRRFVQLVRPRRVIPTVNVGSESARKKMQDIFLSWMREEVIEEPSKQTAIGSFLSRGNVAVAF